MAYCDPDDLLKGDIPWPARFGNGQEMVNLAAEQIDSMIGHIYVTPVVIIVPPAENRPSQLLLKHINLLLASGRMVLDMAAGGEDNDLHAYGQRLLEEALNMLAKIVKGEIQLTGATRIDEAKSQTGPMITNEDAVSMVEDFYKQFRPDTCRALWVAPAPYDGVSS